MSDQTNNRPSPALRRRRWLPSMPSMPSISRGWSFVTHEETSTEMEEQPIDTPSPGSLSPVATRSSPHNNSRREEEEEKKDQSDIQSMIDNLKQKFDEERSAWEGKLQLRDDEFAAEREAREEEFAENVKILETELIEAKASLTKLAATKEHHVREAVLRRVGQAVLAFSVLFFVVNPVSILTVAGTVVAKLGVAAFCGIVILSPVFIGLAIAGLIIGHW
ncbi:unnamed protein product [Calypogeia fissa]